MKSNAKLFRWISGLALTLTAGLACADIVTREPDDYPLYTDLTNVGPGATLSTYHYNGMGGASFHPVYATYASWAPTGKHVFGHRQFLPSQTEYHWVDLMGAYSCGLGSCFGNDFYVFRVDFKQTTDHVGVMTTMLPHAADGAELWAFNTKGQRIAECRVRGVTNIELTTGVMKGAVYGSAVNPPINPQTACGVNVIKKNCAISPIGECEYVITAGIQRINRDIAFVMWGGTSATWTTSPVDKLTYNLKP